MKKFISLTILLILTRFADAQTTYLYTSNLTKEANPLVSIFGLHWTGLLFAEIIGLMILIYALWVYCFKTVQVPKLDKKISLKKFVSLFYFGDTNSFYKLFYKLPTNRNSLLYSIGYILTYSLIAVSVVITYSTTLLLTNKKYQDFYSAYGVPVWLYLFCVATVIFYSINFYRKELRLRTVV